MLNGEIQRKIKKLGRKGERLRRPIGLTSCRDTHRNIGKGVKGYKIKLRVY